jgi:hypothetical protein
VPAYRRQANPEAAKLLCAASDRAKTNCEQRERLSSLIFLEARKGVRADFSVRP